MIVYSGQEVCTLDSHFQFFCCQVRRVYKVLGLGEGAVKSFETWGELKNLMTWGIRVLFRGGVNIWFLEVIEKFLNLDYNESLRYLLYPFTNAMSGKKLLAEICSKILLANQVEGFLNRLYLKN